MYNNKPRKSKKYPFIIHADTLEEATAFPTHTHGLTEVGMPEFIMDPVSFGGSGNANIINRSYRYFRQQKNDLQAVFNEKIVKFSTKLILPKRRNGPKHTICYRIVPATFEAVKLAYFEGTHPGMRFIQIWVDGDDFALTDEYYKGGVKPYPLSFNKAYFK